MWTIILLLAAAALAALWVVVALSEVKKLRLGKQVAFLLGALVVSPAFTAAMLAVLRDTPKFGDPLIWEAIPAAVGMVAGLSLIIWLAGFWLASAIGRFLVRRQVES